jgi:hypothetical protein
MGGLANGVGCGRAAATGMLEGWPQTRWSQGARGGAITGDRSLLRRRVTEHVLQGSGGAQRGLGSGGAEPESGCFAFIVRASHTKLKGLSLALGQAGTEEVGTTSPAGIDQSDNALIAVFASGLSMVERYVLLKRCSSRSLHWRSLEGTGSCRHDRRVHWTAHGGR